MSKSLRSKKKVWVKMDLVPDRRERPRRQHQRYRVNYDSELQSDNICYQCTMVDISKKGCRVITDQPIQNVTDEVIVKFIVPRQLDPIYAKGKIKWKGSAEKEFPVGIEFEKPLSNFDDLI